MSEQTLTTGEVISLGDGRLACPMTDAVQALNGLLDDNLMTHQLSRAARYVMPYVVEACPWVKQIPPMPAIEVESPEKATELLSGWVQLIAAQYGEIHTIPDPSGQWERIDPLKEAQAILGSDRVIPVVVDGVRNG